MDETKILCIKFDFGVPLEDIFPSNDIHPRLKNLFYQTKVALKHSDLCLKDTLKELDISLSEALDLKDALIKGSLRYSEDLRPSSFFWLLRHFFGLLPLPLFPRYTNGKTYNWEYLSTICEVNRLKSDYGLESEISWWIHELPKANVLLIYSLIKFLRRICLRNNFSKRLDCDSVKAATIYFSSSLFLRPYRPGFVTKTDRLFYPFLFYLIVNWSRIRRIQNVLNDELCSILEYNKQSSEKVENCTQSRFVDSSCQTSSCLLLGRNEQVEEICEYQKNKKAELEKAEIVSVLENEEINETEEIYEREETTKVAESETSEKISGLENEEIYECQKNTEVESVKTEISSVLGNEESEKDNYSKLPFSQKIEREKESDEFKTETTILTVEENTENKELIKQANVSGDYSKSCAEFPFYEEILDEKKSNSETVIYKKDNKTNRTPKFIKQKITKANRSLVNVISKIKSKQEELKSGSGPKLEKHKYDLLKDSNVAKTQSLHASHGVKESPNIKYKKLRTL